MADTKTYEVIEESQIVNLNNEPVGKLQVGESISGELVLIDDEPYIETSEGYIKAKGLAEKLDQSDFKNVEAKVKSKNTKLIFSLVGAAVGYGVAHYMKKDMKTKVMFTVGGLALGLGLEYINSKRDEK
jgi:hypothetical protein